MLDSNTGNDLTVCKQMNFSSLKNFHLQTIHLQIIYLSNIYIYIYIYKQDLALNNLQGLLAVTRSTI